VSTLERQRDEALRDVALVRAQLTDATRRVAELHDAVANRDRVLSELEDERHTVPFCFVVCDYHVFLCCVDGMT
jgi:hypothetical protein